MTIRQFIATRAMLLIPVFLILFTLVFFLTRLLPGDAAMFIMGPNAPLEQLERMRHILGLDQPLHIQYLTYLGNLFRGDFGSTMVTGRPVLPEILYRFPVTLELAIAATVVSVVIGVASGILGAVKAGRPIDHFLRVSSLIAYSTPSFVAGILLQLLFAVFLGVLPLFGRIDFGITLDRITGMAVLDSILTLNGEALVSTLKHIALPCIALSIYNYAIFHNLTYANMLEQRQERYIYTARMKGLSEYKVALKHVFPNAFIPVLTMMSFQFGLLLGGSIIVESIFAIEGIGSYLMYGITHRDLNIIQGTLVFYAIITAIMSLAVDVLYVVFDPRISL